MHVNTSPGWLRALVLAASSSAIVVGCAAGPNNEGDQTAASTDPLGSRRCDSYYDNSKAKVLDVYKQVFSSSCREIRDTSGFVPALSALPWKCCSTASGPICAGYTEIVEKGAPIDWISCKAGTVLVDAREDHKRIRIYNTAQKLVQRSEWSVTNSKSYYITANGPRISSAEDWVEVFDLATPGDMATATNSYNGLVERVTRGGMEIFHDKGRLQFAPNGTQTTVCGEFQSYDDYDNTNARICKALGTTAL